MPVDNQLYDRLSDTWWDDGFLTILKTSLNPVRFGYMRRILIDELRRDPKGLRVLDVGCGGGLLAEEFAQLGCAVTGVDPSTKSLEVARAHAREEGFEIEYRESSGESLPFADGEFPVVYCCDVLEHVDDVGQTISEVSRVLEPGGVFLYDTINRTVRAKFLMIKLAQDWSATAWAEPDLHDYGMFITPAELDAHLKRAGLEKRDQVGFAASSPFSALRGMWERAHGKINYRELGERLEMKESRDTSATYGGYALKM
jgi:2-polyprenyl-6-hydroxyphenyl methylase / 3-demethylubiquinone-9 3-methyltransferase